MADMIRDSGSPKTEQAMKRITRNLQSNMRYVIDEYAQMCCDMLTSATPYDSGETAYSWSYKIKKDKDVFRIQFDNDNVVNGANVALLLQYGHATRNGGYFPGVDYINEPVKEVFERTAQELWDEVVTAWR